MWGGKPIRDATATPADVASGKVFYNNEGRQIGAFTDCLKMSQFVFPEGNYVSVNSFTMYYFKFYRKSGQYIYTNINKWNCEERTLCEEGGSEDIDRKIEVTLPAEIKFSNVEKIIIRGKDEYNKRKDDASIVIKLYHPADLQYDGKYGFHFSSELWHNTNSGSGFLYFALINNYITSIGLGNKSFSYNKIEQDITVEVYYR